MIRSQSGASQSLTGTTFVSAFTKAVLHGLAEVEQDDTCDESEFIPAPFPRKSMEESSVDLAEAPVGSVMTDIDLNVYLNAIPDYFDGMGGQTAQYVSSFVVTRVLKDNLCDSCKSVLCSSTFGEDLESIRVGDHSLLTSSDKLFRTIAEACASFEEIIPVICHSKSLSQVVIDAILPALDFSWLYEACPSHSAEVIDNIFKSFNFIMLSWWCNRENKKIKSLK